MNVISAAKECRQYIDKCTIPENDPDYGKDHLLEMVEKIETGIVTGEKAHRWLGYLQGVLVATGGTSLEKMKATNLEQINTHIKIGIEIGVL